MPSGRLGAVALIAAGALWAQLVLLPIVASMSHGTSDVLSMVVGTLALAIAVGGIVTSNRNERVAVALVLAGFPIALGLFGLVATRQLHARFDVAARLIAAATGVAFAASAVAWARSLSPLFPVTVGAMERRDAKPKGPPMQREAFALVTGIAAFLAVVAPAMVTAHAPLTRAERVGGESLVRARDAITSAGGLALALLMVLGAGGSLMRRSGTRSRSATRAIGFMLWGVAMFVLDWLVRSQR
jgi:hypothetical protein